MAIFVDDTTKVLVQGLTGGQGRFHGLRNRADRKSTRLNSSHDET